MLVLRLWAGGEALRLTESPQTSQQPHGAGRLKTWALGSPIAPLGYPAAFLRGILRAGVAIRNHAIVQNLKGKTHALIYQDYNHEKIKIPSACDKSYGGADESQSLPFQPWSGGVKGAPSFGLLCPINCSYLNGYWAKASTIQNASITSWRRALFRFRSLRTHFINPAPAPGMRREVWIPAGTCQFLANPA